MLVLARKVEQRIQIGRDITITVLRIRSGAVKIGIEAPQGTPVFRTEVLARRAAEREAAGGDPRGASAAAGESHPPRAAASACPVGAAGSATCEEDIERPRSERGATVKIGPGMHLAQQPSARPAVAPFRFAAHAADSLADLSAVTAVG